MAEAILEQKDSQVVRLVGLSEALSSEVPSWVDELRETGRKKVEEMGFPSQKEEAWRFTDLKPIRDAAFVLPSPGEASVTRSELGAHPFLDPGKPGLTFVNGAYEEELSNPGELPEGVQVRPLSAAYADDADMLQKYLAQVARHEDFFAALNLAMLEEGVLIQVPSGVVVEEPIQLNFLMRPTGQEPLLVNNRVLIVCGDNSQISILENHLGLQDEGRYLSNVVTEIVVGDNAAVDHYKLQQESSRGWHLATIESTQGRDSSVRNTTVTLAGAIVRNQTNATLAGEGGWAELNGLFLVGDDHHVDNYTQLRHSKPHCDSREVYRGILADSSTGVFRGRIVVDKGAQKTDSKQTNSNLLLSDRARVNTKPQLEIYADDVKCTHGATIGQLDHDQIFYLRSRGISMSAARSMLIYAFANQLVREIKVESFRERLDSYLFDWLPEGERVKEAF